MDRHRAALVAITVLLYGAVGVAALTNGEGLSLEGIAFFGGGPIYATVGCIILIHRPGHRIGRLLLLLGIALTFTAVGPMLLDVLSPLRWAIRPLRTILAFFVEWAGPIAILVGTILVLVWFPSGRATSRLGRVIELASVVFVVGTIPSSLNGPDELASAAVFLAIIGLYLLAILELGIRTAHAASREQGAMRWVFASAAIVTLFMVGVMTIGSNIPALWSLWINSTILPAIAVAIAISRHHLYDIDRLISRSISYSLVTVILFAVFGIVNITLQTAFGSMVPDNSIAVAVSTLVVATLFQPLRVRLQRIVDRRFDRGHYDAARTVEAYAGRLRDEIDLTTLTGDLQLVTATAVQPSSTGVWLRASGPP